MIPGYTTNAEIKVLTDVLRKNPSWYNNYCEIGTHFGKSVKLVSKHWNFKQIFVVDIFDQQDLNIDSSGRSFLNIFKGLHKRLIKNNRLTIIQNDSRNVTSLDFNQQIDVMLIDGAHHYEAVLNDLKLAAEITSDHSILVIDDFFNDGFAEIQYAFYSSNLDWFPFMIFGNKLYCAKSTKYSKIYFDYCEEILGKYRRKYFKILGCPVISHNKRRNLHIALYNKILEEAIILLSRLKFI